MMRDDAGGRLVRPNGPGDPQPRAQGRGRRPTPWVNRPRSHATIKLKHWRKRWKHRHRTTGAVLNVGVPEEPDVCPQVRFCESRGTARSLPRQPDGRPGDAIRLDRRLVRGERHTAREVEGDRAPGRRARALTNTRMP